MPKFEREEYDKKKDAKKDLKEKEDLSSKERIERIEIFLGIRKV